MKAFRNVSLVVLSIICILLTSFTLIYESLNTTILKPYASINYLDDSKIYLDVEKAVEDEISKKVESMDIVNGPISLVLDDLINISITEKWISRLSMDLQTALWDYITDKTDTIDILSFTEFNNYINEIFENESSLLFDNNLIIENSDVNEYISDYVSYAEKAKNYYQLMNIFEVYMYLTLAFILILIFVLALRVRKSIKWLGITLIISSLVSFLPVILLNLEGKQIIYNQIEFIDYYSYFESSLINLTDILVKDISMNLSIFSFIVLLLGLFSLLLNKAFIRRSDKQKVI